MKWPAYALFMMGGIDVTRFLAIIYHTDNVFGKDFYEIAGICIFFELAGICTFSKMDTLKIAKMAENATLISRHMHFLWREKSP